MRRDDYQIFSPAKIGPMTTINRLIRSATWDRMGTIGKVTSAHVKGYTKLAEGGVGLIVTGLLPVWPSEAFKEPEIHPTTWGYDDVAIEGIGEISDAVHRAAPGCKIVAQLWGPATIGPSSVTTPFQPNGIRQLSKGEVQIVASAFASAVSKLKDAGFDGVQLFACHGKSVLFNFLSPHFNHRKDEYGGSATGRANVIREIIKKARDRVGDYPILIKMNCTDYLPDGTTRDSFHEMALQMIDAGIDAIEVSGGTYECLLRTEDELGFRPVYSADKHTNVRIKDKQSYYLPFVQGLTLDIPLILVGGNRNVERVEEIIRSGSAQFVSMCRPLVSEPDLPRRWFEGHGDVEASCVGCNSCSFSVRELNYEWPTCLYKQDRELHQKAQRWVTSWVKNTVQ